MENLSSVDDEIPVKEESKECSDSCRKRKNSPSIESEPDTSVPSKILKLKTESVQEDSQTSKNLLTIEGSEDVGKGTKRPAEIESNKFKEKGILKVDPETACETPRKKAKLDVVKQEKETITGLSKAGDTGTSANSGSNVASNLTVKQNLSPLLKGGDQKRVRRRTKFLLQIVLEQMEFYFSDSNLSKDRFVRQLMDQDKEGYVDLSIFGNFNKLQSLHKDGVSCDILRKAIKRSKSLKLSDDKNRVRRITPFKPISQEETDKRTIYVENLPSRATHAWIRTLFAQCGNVVYVSLPVYRTTKEKKGFAFVEFETAEQAAKACLMNNPPPDRAQAVAGKFPKSNKTLCRLQKIVPEKLEGDSNDENVPEDQTEEVENITEEHLEQGKKKKKKKGKKKKNQEDSEKNLETASEEKLDTAAGQQSEGRKKKKKKKKKRSSLQQDSATDDVKADTAIDSSVQVGDPQASDKSESLKDGDQSTEGNENLKQGESQVDTKSTDLSTSVASDKERSADESKTEDDSMSTEQGGRKKRKRKKRKRCDSDSKDENVDNLTNSKKIEPEPNIPKTDINTQEVSLSRKERKRLRQEDIRRKKREREAKEREEQGVQIAVSEEQEKEENLEMEGSAKRARTVSEVSAGSQLTDSESEDPSKVLLKRDGSQVMSILKTRKQVVSKKVEFDLVPERNEFVRPKEVRKRKRLKKEKVQLRILSKKEWDSLRAEYIKRQKSHMAALKESLRELRQRENAERDGVKGQKHVDLEDVFGTKRLKPSHEVKMAHVEALEFIPNVIVQWKSTHVIHRDKIRSMLRDNSSIAYIDAQEEAKCGYIRFKDEDSAKNFTKMCRSSTSFTSRLLPAEQQQAYWTKANEDRMKRLGRKRQERGSERLARKVFERNKVTFQQKPNRIVFTEDIEDDGEIVPYEQKRMGINDYNPEEDADTWNVSYQDSSNELETSR